MPKDIYVRSCPAISQFFVYVWKSTFCNSKSKNEYIEELLIFFIQRSNFANILKTHLLRRCGDEIISSIGGRHIVFNVHLFVVGISNLSNFVEFYWQLCFIVSTTRCMQNPSARLTHHHLFQVRMMLFLVPKHFWRRGDKYKPFSRNITAFILKHYRLNKNHAHQRTTLKN